MWKLLRPEKPVTLTVCVYTRKGCSHSRHGQRPGLVNGQSQSYRERTHEGYAYVERSVAEGIRQPAGHCHKGHAMVNDALCNHCDLAAEDMEIIAFGKASIKRVKRV
eukprot:359094-Chlamydomonas_euryale.AAC.29